MSEEVRKNVFEPFYTTKREKGSGLGLSMVYGFAKQSNGHIAVESEAGQGTTVRLYLPRGETADQRAASEAANAEPRARGETVLVVEDDAGVRELAVSLLESLGYQVFSAEDGKAALRLTYGVGSPEGVAVVAHRWLVPEELEDGRWAFDADFVPPPGEVAYYIVLHASPDDPLGAGHARTRDGRAARLLPASCP